MTESSPTDAEARSRRSRRRTRKKGGFFRRHLLLTAVVVLLVCVTAGAIGLNSWVNYQLDKVPRVDAGITAPTGTTDVSDKQRGLTILLLGTDNGDARQTTTEDLEDGSWTPGVRRSDTMMLAHIPADRSGVQIVSIPRDTWVRMPGVTSNGGHAKINAAYSYGGPKLAVRTVESYTGLHVDHLALIDWQGFTALNDAVGGVRVYIPESFRSQWTYWKRGWTVLKGARALLYVRTRYSIPGERSGDFGRTARQQNYLRALSGEVLSNETFTSPSTMNKVLGSLQDFLVLDATWSSGELRDLAWSMRGVRQSDVSYAIFPFGGYGTSADGQSYVRAAPRSREMFRLLGRGRLPAYLAKYPRDRLGGTQSVN